MDWTKQTEEMIRTWTEAQRRMWESWLGAVQDVETSQTAGAWEQAVESWRAAVERALEEQVAWTRSWADRVTAGGATPKEVADWSRQVLEMMQRWTEAQKPLWERWFELLKRADPSAAPSTLADAAQKVTQAWQEAAQKALDAQQEWARRWGGAQSRQ